VIRPASSSPSSSRNSQRYRSPATGRAARAGVAERARERGIEVIVLSPGQDLAALASQAAAGGADALGMAGGDGSLAIVAAAAAAHGIPFVCVPAGTRNHFALDMGVDRRDVTGALGAFTDGVERRIDMAEVNGRTFLNNVSLGVYGDAVRSSAYRDAKARTLLETAAEVLGPSAQAPELRLLDDLGREYLHPAVVLVSNNPYALDRPLARGTRPTLGGGQLGIIVLDAPGDSPRAPGRAWNTPRLEVSAPRPVHAGIAGIELLVQARPALREALIRARSEISGLRDVARLIDSVAPGLYRRIRQAPYSNEGFGAALDDVRAATGRQVSASAAQYRPVACGFPEKPAGAAEGRPRRLDREPDCQHPPCGAQTVTPERPRAQARRLAAKPEGSRT
jgi:hypothetical protein